MCKEAFTKCVDYLDKNLTEAERAKRLPSNVVSETRNGIAKIRGLLDQRLFDVNKVEPLVNSVKDKLFAALMNGRCNVTQGDITDQNTDAIVNAANTQLKLGGGVAGAIRTKGGPQVQVACDSITKGGKQPLEMGKVATTTGGKIGPQIIHAAVMEWGGKATPESIRRATRNIVIEAKSKGFKTLSIPALGAGAGGVNPMESAQAIQKGLYDVVLELAAFDEIKIVAFDPNTQAAFQQVFSGGINHQAKAA